MPASGDIVGQIERLLRRAVWSLENGRPIEGAKALRRLRTDLDMAVLVSRGAGGSEPAGLLRLKEDVNRRLAALNGGSPGSTTSPALKVGTPER